MEESAGASLSVVLACRAGGPIDRGGPLVAALSSGRSQTWARSRRGQKASAGLAAGAGRTGWREQLGLTRGSGDGAAGRGGRKG